LLFAASHVSVANIEEVPAADAGEVEDDSISNLAGAVKARPICGAALRVVVEALRMREAAEQQQGESQHC